MEETKDLVNKVFDIGFESEAKFGGCAQCVLYSLSEIGVPIDPEVIKAATGLAAGIARSGNACGALTGGIMAISCLAGRGKENMEDTSVSGNCVDICRKLVDRFMKEYGSCNCRDIQYNIMGASFRMYDAEDRARFLEAGGHDDKCTGVVGRSAGWVTEILKEEGLF